LLQTCPALRRSGAERWLAIPPIAGRNVRTCSLFTMSNITRIAVLRRRREARFLFG
jgi:hypothetical protein